MGSFLRDSETRAKEFSLLERVIRVEEELRSLRELRTPDLKPMKNAFKSFTAREIVRFDAMDKRFEALQREMNVSFEAVDKRFEAVEKRLNFMQWFMGIGFTFIVVIMSLFNFLK